MIRSHDPRALLLELARAQLSSRSARVRFRDTERSVAERTVDVLALAFEPPRWVVAIWSAELGSLRLLDLARVEQVRPTRRRAGTAPEGFDPVHFAVRPLLDPGAGPPRPVTVRVASPWGAVARALLPTAVLERTPGGGAVLHVLASRPEAVRALAESLAACPAIDSPSLPMVTARTAKQPHEARLLRLAAWILSQSGPVTRTQLFAAFPDEYGGKPDGAERKFTRDKDALKRLGFHLETEELGGREDQVGYAIDARSSMLPPVDLGADEAAALWTAGVGALRLSLHPLREELESGLRKLVVGAKGLPPRAAATEELAGDAGPDAERLLPRLVDAWERRRRVRLAYWRVSSGEVVERDVDVYGWARRRGEWIFVGHCHLRKGVRIFYLSRVRGLEAVRPGKDEAAARARRGKKGDYDVPETFDVRRWSRQQIWDYDVHPPLAAAVRLRGSLAGIARQLLPAAQVATDGSGARVARLPVRNLRGLVRQALAWGPEAEVLEPPEARAMAREILASVLRTGSRGEP